MRFWRLLRSILLIAVLGLTTSPTSAFAVSIAPPVVTPPTSSAANASEADETPDSPRASMRAYLDLCDRSRFEEAARYLDLPRGQEKKGPELAQKLFVVLEARLLVSPDQLSPRPEGKADEPGIPAGTEELGKLKDAKGHNVAIRIVRHDAKTPEDESRWVFSQTTVQAVDPLYASLRGRWIRDRLPAFLLEQGPWSLYFWQWLAIPVLAGIALGIGRILTWMCGKFARALLGRLPWTARILDRLARPVTVGWAIVVFWLLVPDLALTIRAEELMGRILRALAYLAFFWGLLRTVSVAGDELATGEYGEMKPSLRSLTSVGVRLGKLVVGAIALMVALSALGYPVTTVIAGLGIGGVALALAAQKTVENLFGSVSILVDQPFQVGDTIRVDTVEGTVETIGLRSTRMRTVDRTLIIIPNGKLADMRIESLGPRDRMRFATRLSLARETSSDQLRKIVEEIAKDLRAHEKVRVNDVSVRLGGLGEQSYDIDASATVETVDANEFAKVREDLLLACVAAVERSGAQLAVPVRKIVTPNVKTS